ncbi:hypothetical protein K504DRAFT_92107 [Pleomassaria siparia CBS 279.74]|uniref:Uncharacterized protein n=1 Tax=Pleomassaria siparia CBS 279.74 TaxID=1314801 RepID=A0A6G1JZ84_9PLEO|nr:hypothetical protein K504DRAFT_92107 [Pleomassaria siparia CBS 279.74]
MLNGSKLSPTGSECAGWEALREHAGFVVSRAVVTAQRSALHPCWKAVESAYSEYSIVSSRVPVCVWYVWCVWCVCVYACVCLCVCLCVWMPGCLDA